MRQIGFLVKTKNPICKVLRVKVAPYWPSFEVVKKRDAIKATRFFFNYTRCLTSLDHFFVISVAGNGLEPLTLRIVDGLG